MAKKILFVCTGNTCRSSMAEAIALKIIAENPEKFGDVWVTSAGTYALEGTPAASHAIKIAEEKGMNLQDFRSKPISSRLIEEADLILTMTNSHKQQLLNLAPYAKNKIFLLKEYADNLEQKENLEKRAEMIYAQIKDKKREFLLQHEKKLSELEKRKNELEKELQTVLSQLDMLEEQLEAELKTEREELAAIERALGNLEVSDPFGQPLEVYRACYEELYEAIEKALEKIIY